MLSGCGGNKTSEGQSAAPAANGRYLRDFLRLQSRTFPRRNRLEGTPSPGESKKQEKADDDASALSVPEGTKPLSVETGKASWYGAPLRQPVVVQNGQIYDMNQLTAAHLTLSVGIDGASHQPQDRPLDHRSHYRSGSLCERPNCGSFTGRSQTGGCLEGRRGPGPAGSVTDASTFRSWRTMGRTNWIIRR